MSEIRPRASACRLATIVAAVLVLGTPDVRPAGFAGDTAPEYQVKAAFLASFAKFVEWPPTRVPWPGAPFVLAVLGSDPLGAYLREAAAAKLVAGHPIEVRAVSGARDARVAHVVFIGESERERLPAILRDLHPAGVLTVADSDGFGAAGVILNLYVEERHVRFEVNRSAAARAGLRLNAQILAIARPTGGGS